MSIMTDVSTYQHGLLNLCVRRAVGDKLFHGYESVLVQVHRLEDLVHVSVGAAGRRTGSVAHQLVDLSLIHI